MSHAVGHRKRLEVLRLLGPPDEQRGLNGLNLPMLRTLQLFRCVHCYDEKPDPFSEGLRGALPPCHHGTTVLTIADPWAPSQVTETLLQRQHLLRSLSMDDLQDSTKFTRTWTTKITQLLFDVHRDSLEYIKIGEPQLVLQTLPDLLSFLHRQALELSDCFLFPVTPYSPSNSPEMLSLRTQCSNKKEGSWFRSRPTPPVRRIRLL